MNQVSHFLDASTIYGSTLERSLELRSFENGKLRVAIRGNHEYLPVAEKAIECLTKGACYKTGKKRYRYICFFRMQ